MKHVETEQCYTCKGEKYLPTYVERPDGFFDRVYARCEECKGAGAITAEWSDTPLLDYVRKHLPA